jgi:excisionase family DNA binding protein
MDLHEAKAPQALRQDVEIVGRRLALSVEEAAELLGISRSLAYELAARGQLPVLRLGRRLVIPRAALERLLDGTER